MNKKTIILAIIGLIIIAGVVLYFGFLQSPPRLVDGGKEPVFAFKVGESPTNVVLHNNSLYSFRSYDDQELLFDQINLATQAVTTVSFKYPTSLGRLNVVLPPDMQIADGVVYIMLHAQKVILTYDLQGNLLNYWQVGDITTTSEIAINQQRVYLLVPQKRVVITLGADGSELSRFSVDKGSVRLLAQDHIYVGNVLGFFVSYSASGEELARIDLGLRYIYNIALDAERVYVAYTDEKEGKNHLCITDRTGKALKSYDLPYVITGLHVHEGKVYISDENRQEVLVYDLSK